MKTFEGYHQHPSQKELLDKILHLSQTKKIKQIASYWPNQTDTKYEYNLAAENKYSLKGLKIPKSEMEPASTDHVSVSTVASTNTVRLKQGLQGKTVS